mmetsp:Transcript_54664/g.106934  ORF Transcript_54664/g.106934 Transcript_54664/m.106934 type:complete len:80 (-) Transcript_54664:259-498(-)
MPNETVFLLVPSSRKGTIKRDEGGENCSKCCRQLTARKRIKGQQNETEGEDERGQQGRGVPVHLSSFVSFSCQIDACPR